MRSVDWNDLHHCLYAIELHTSRTQCMEYRPSYLPPPTITCQCLRVPMSKVSSDSFYVCNF